MVNFKKEIDKDLIRFLIDNFPEKVFSAYFNNFSGYVYFSKKAFQTALMQNLYKVGIPIKNIAEYFNLPINIVKIRLKRKYYPESVKNAWKIFGFDNALSIAEKYDGYKVFLSKKAIDMVLAEDLIRAWKKPKKIANGLNIHIRKAQRIKKFLKDEYGESI